MKILLENLNDGSEIKSLINQWGIKSKLFKWQLTLITAIISIITLLILTGANETKLEKQATANYDASLIAETPPNSGVLYRRTRINSLTELPTMRVRPDTVSPNYLIKIIDSNTNQLEIVAFIRAGQVTDFDVPVGEYKVKIASGYGWYGINHLFGSKTKYSEAEQIFSFKIEGNQLVGKELILKSVKGGNLREREINSNDF